MLKKGYRKIYFNIIVVSYFKYPSQWFFGALFLYFTTLTEETLTMKLHNIRIFSHILQNKNRINLLSLTNN